MLFHHSTACNFLLLETLYSFGFCNIINSSFTFSWNFLPHLFGVSYKIFPLPSYFPSPTTLCSFILLCFCSQNLQHLTLYLVICLLTVPPTVHPSPVSNKAPQGWDPVLFPPIFSVTTTDLAHSKPSINTLKE